MKIKILKSVFVDGEQYKKGDIVEVSPNLAHGLTEAGLAFKVWEGVKEFSKPPKDKMMSKKRKRTHTK